MKRKDFIKTLAAACAAPVVAAKAIASHDKEPRLLVHNTCQSTIDGMRDYEGVQLVYDDDVNGWCLKPEDTPLYRSIQHLAQ